jgi:hypothetical protein
MIEIKDRCPNCCKFQVPAEHVHLVKPEQFDRICSCKKSSVMPSVVIGAAGAILTALAMIGAVVYHNHKTAEDARDRASVYRLMDAGLSEAQSKMLVRNWNRLD